jgi:hypothetical protein
MTDEVLTRNVCKECRALIPDQTVEGHKQWHEATVSWMETLTDRVDRLERRASEPWAP